MHVVVQVFTSAFHTRCACEEGRAAVPRAHSAPHTADEEPKRLCMRACLGAILWEQGTDVLQCRLNVQFC